MVIPDLIIEIVRLRLLHFVVYIHANEERFGGRKKQ